MSKDEIIAEKEMEIASKIATIASKEQENAILKTEINYLKKMLYGSKTERFKSEVDSNQLNLFGEHDQQVDHEKQQEEETISYTRKKKSHPGRHPLPDHLPVEEIIIEPDEDVSGLKKIGEEITETLKYTPASLVKVRLIRPKYEKVDQGGVIIAPMPLRPINKSIAEASLLTHVIVSKFIDHLPFYRQIQRFKRDFDWILSASTLNDWFVACCTLLKPVYDQMVKQIQTSHYIQVDESPIKVLESEKKKQTHQGYQWVYHDPIEKTIVFHYRKGRGMQGPKEFLANYSGYLQCDGYTVYDKIGLRDAIQLVGCLAHARRYFHEALDNDKQRAAYALKIIQDIYNLERSWKSEETTAIYKNRQDQIKPMFENLKIWCEKQALVILPKSKIGKAVRYWLNQYHKLIVSIEDGKLEMDNNLIENKIRPLALGRKNYLFAGSHDGGQRIAMMYSFFATCKARNINPKEWLHQSLVTLADPNFKEFTKLIPQ